MFSATRALAPVARDAAAPRAFLSRRVGPAETEFSRISETSRRCGARARAPSSSPPRAAGGARRRQLRGRRLEPASASASSADDVVMYAFNDDGSATVSAIAFDVAAADSDVAELEASVARHPAATPGASSSISAAARAPAPAAPAAPRPVAAEGQHEDSAMAAFTSDDMLCMLYGVDQDKEDAKHKVAFFDVDAVVDPEALRRVLAAAAAESRRPDPIAPSETTETMDLVARFGAARSRCPAWARVALAPRVRAHHPPPPRRLRLRRLPRLRLYPPRAKRALRVAPRRIVRGGGHVQPRDGASRRAHRPRGVPRGGAVRRTASLRRV